MKAGDIARKAADLVSGDRAQTHGDMAENFSRVAALWNAWLYDRIQPGCEIGPEDVAHMMSLLKKARTKSGTRNSDDYIDDVGYSACAGEIALKEYRR